MFEQGNIREQTGYMSVFHPGRAEIRSKFIQRFKHNAGQEPGIKYLQGRALKKNKANSFSMKKCTATM